MMFFFSLGIGANASFLKFSWFEKTTLLNHILADGYRGEMQPSSSKVEGKINQFFSRAQVVSSPLMWFSRSCSTLDKAFEQKDEISDAVHEH